MDEPTKQPSPPSKHSSSRSRWLWLLSVALIAVAVYYYRTSEAKGAGAGSPSVSSKKKGGKGGGEGAVPVVGTRARKGNIGVYFNGLGAVTPIYTVTVKSRVDGELMTVHFHEGDMVHKGDLLMEIDPRPYQVQLTQAEGQLARDQATLENARIDLARYESC